MVGKGLVSCLLAGTTGTPYSVEYEYSRFQTPTFALSHSYGVLRMLQIPWSDSCIGWLVSVFCCDTSLCTRSSSTPHMESRRTESRFWWSPWDPAIVPALAILRALSSALFVSLNLSLPVDRHSIVRALSSLAPSLSTRSTVRQSLVPSVQPRSIKITPPSAAHPPLTSTHLTLFLLSRSIRFRSIEPPPLRRGPHTTIPPSPSFALAVSLLPLQTSKPIHYYLPLPLGRSSPPPPNRPTSTRT